MLATLLLWGLLLGAALPWGLTLFAASGHQPFEDSDFALDDVLIALFAGLLVLSMIALAVALILPLGSVAGLVTLALAVFSPFLWRGMRQKIKLALISTRPLWMAGSLIFMAASIDASEYSVLADTRFYHEPLSHWINQVGLVPGMGLFQIRFATLSSWFALFAPFDSGSLAGRVAGMPSPLLVGLAALQVAIAARRSLEGKGVVPHVFLMTTLGFEILYQQRVVWRSMSPDLPVMIVFPIMMFLWMRAPAGRYGYPLMRSALLLAAVALPLKLSMGLLILVLMIGAFPAIRSMWPQRWKFAFLIVICWSIYAAANILTSGCILYPVAMTCFEPTWGLPIQSAHLYTKFLQEGNGTFIDTLNGSAVLSESWLIAVAIAVISTIWLIARRGRRLILGTGIHGSSTLLASVISISYVIFNGATSTILRYCLGGGHYGTGISFFCSSGKKSL